MNAAPRTCLSCCQLVASAFAFVNRHKYERRFARSRPDFQRIVVVGLGAVLHFYGYFRLKRRDGAVGSDNVCIRNLVASQGQEMKIKSANSKVGGSVPSDQVSAGMDDAPNCPEVVTVQLAQRLPDELAICADVGICPVGGPAPSRKTVECKWYVFKLGDNQITVSFDRLLH